MSVALLTSGTIHEFSKAGWNGAFRRLVFVPQSACVGPMGPCRALSTVGDPLSSEPIEYQVRYTDGSEGRVSEVDLTPAEDQQPADPLHHLRAFETDAYAMFRDREKLADTHARAVREAGGHRALLSSRIDLRPHQAFVAGTVLFDLRRRYIFADEVGLGKTIEAGIIIHDLLLQNPEARVLVLCPGTLTCQWLTELYAKFGGYVFQVLDLHEGKALDPGRLRRAIVSTSRAAHELESILSAIPWDLVVIDEAHHLVSSPVLYEFALRLARAAPSLLLLSAIPARRRRDDFLALLRLLEPDRYSRPNIELEFEALYDAQTDIGRRLRILHNRTDAFRRGDASAADVIDVARRLTTTPIVIHDAEVQAMVDGLAVAGVTLLDQVGRIAHVVSERYRLNRRILRNRRSHLVSEQQLAPIARQLRRVSYCREQLEIDAEQAALLILRAAQEAGMNQFVLLAFARELLPCLASPSLLHATLERLRHVAPRTLSAVELGRATHIDLTAPGERAYCMELLCAAVRAAVPGHLIDAAIEGAARWKTAGKVPRFGALLAALPPATARGRRPRKVVVFAGQLGLAADITERLRKKLGSPAVVEFVAELPMDVKETNILRFRSDVATRVLVVDESGGEGRNFQFADELIHYDTPWYVSRVEQRIGRLDRIGREQYSKEVISNVLVAEGSVEAGLVECYAEGVQVYSESISGLEFALREVDDTLATQTLGADPFEALRQLVPALRESAVAERQRDDADAVLDEASFDRQAAASFLKVRPQETTEAELEKAFVAYFRLLAPKGVGSEIDPLLGCTHWLFSAEKARLGSLHVPEGGNSRFRGTFRRAIAQQRPSLGFFQVGNPLYDAVIATLETRPTGRVYAIFCRVPGFRPWKGLEFVFVARPDPQALHATPRFGSRLHSVFRPQTTHVLIDLDGVVEAASIELLDLRRSLADVEENQRWVDCTAENGRRVRGILGSRWAGSVDELYERARLVARQLAAARLQPELDAEFARLERLERALECGPEEGRQSELVALREFRTALGAWRLDFDSAGLLVVNVDPRDLAR